MFARGPAALPSGACSPDASGREGTCSHHLLGTEGGDVSSTHLWSKLGVSEGVSCLLHTLSCAHTDGDTYYKQEEDGPVSVAWRAVRH